MNKIIMFVGDQFNTAVNHGWFKKPISLKHGVVMKYDNTFSFRITMGQKPNVYSTIK
jgi:hypothetical protein